ncbi:enhancer of mRNA decapping [Nowakowskiella sp. JEL0407]|nr:enhancer of mRNA decapping [Nowakowskiella sp. JEL0407]
MAGSFVGLDVNVYLKSGEVVEGKVSKVDPKSHSLYLQTVQFQNGIAVENTVLVKADTIEDLKIIRKQNQPQPPQHLSNHSLPTNPQLPPFTPYGFPNPALSPHQQVPFQYPSPPPQISHVPNPITIPPVQAVNPAAMALQQHLFGVLKLPPQNSGVHLNQPFLGSSQIGEGMINPGFYDPAVAQISISKNSANSNSVPNTPTQAHVNEKSDQKPTPPTNFLSSPNPNKPYEDEISLDEEDDTSEDLMKVNIPVTRSSSRNGFLKKQKSVKKFEKRKKKDGNNSNTKKPSGRNSFMNSDNNTWTDSVQDCDSEFDFQASLNMFDKKRFFEEVRESDTKDPETLLVNQNRVRKQSTNNNGKQYLQQKLGIREMVLDYETGNDAEVEDSEASEFVTVGNGDESLMKENGYSGSAGVAKPTFRTTFQEIEVPSVTPAEMIEIDRIAASETGPNDDQMIENGARCVAMMALQTLGGGRRIRPGNHNSAPLVVVLAGNNKTGAYGLGAARHLANHQCHVIAFVVGKEAELVNTVAYQQKILLPAGGKIIKNLSELPYHVSQPVDLIIDSILGYSQNFTDLSSSDKNTVNDLINWVANNRASTLSLDIPSGIHPLTGQPVTPLYIIPRWVLAFALPKTGLSCLERMSGVEVLLGDIGIPAVVFQKLAKVLKSQGNLPVKYFFPFEDKFVVGLERRT